MLFYKKRYAANFILILFLLMSVFLPIRSALAEQEVKKIQVVYFHGNLCELCDEEFKFKSMFSLKTGKESDGVELEFKIYNIFEDDGDKKLKEYYSKYNVPQDKQEIPAVFIGNSYIMGEKAIEKGIKEALIKAKAELGTDTGTSSPIEKDGNNGEEGKNFFNNENIIKSNKTLLIYFYLSSCTECDKVAKFMSTLKKEYQVILDGKSINSNVEITKFNISKSENIMIAKQYFEYFKVPEKDRKVPIIFLGDTYITGEKAIQERLEENIEGGLGLGTPRLNMEKGTPDKGISNLTWGNIIGAFLAGLANGVNPCSLSMLLFFLSMLLMKSVNVLKAGFSFIAGKFITYLVLGILLYNVLASLNLAWIQIAIKITLLIIIMVLIALNIQDFFAARNEKYDKIRLQLPASLRKFNHKWIKKITGIENMRLLLLVSFGLGVVISVGEFLCTGQIYLASIMYMLQSSMVINIQALILFLVYAIAFVLPLIILTFIIHKGREIFDVSEFIRGKMHIIKLVNTIIFVLFGIFVLLKF